MSAEKIINIKETLNTTKVDVQESSGRVDINHLLARVRKQKDKEKVRRKRGQGNREKGEEGKIGERGRAEEEGKGD